MRREDELRVSIRPSPLLRLVVAGCCKYVRMSAAWLKKGTCARCFPLEIGIQIDIMGCQVRQGIFIEQLVQERNLFFYALANMDMRYTP